MLKIPEICRLKRFVFTSKCTKMRLVAGLRTDPLGKLTALPRWIKGGGEGRGMGKGRKKGRGGKRERKKERGEPPMTEVC